jgi:hypothetical protein
MINYLPGASASGGIPATLDGIVTGLYIAQLSTKYSLENTNKKLLYRGITSSQYNNIPVNSTFNQLINTGVSNPTGVLIVPFIESQTTQGFGEAKGNHLLIHVLPQHDQYL